MAGPGAGCAGWGDQVRSPMSRSTLQSGPGVWEPAGSRAAAGNGSESERVRWPVVVCDELSSGCAASLRVSFVSDLLVPRPFWALHSRFGALSLTS